MVPYIFICIAVLVATLILLVNQRREGFVNLVPSSSATTKTGKGDEMNAFIIPAEGKQISSDKIIVPVLKDRKFALLKITFKQ